MALVTAQRRPEVHGILVQMPLPARIDAPRVLDAIDGQGRRPPHPINAGR